MLSVRLDPNLEYKLKRAAEIEGKPVSEFVREAVEARCNAVFEGQTLDVVLADYVGALASGGELNARDAEEEFGKILEEKRRSGHI